MATFKPPLESEIEHKKGSAATHDRGVLITPGSADSGKRNVFSNSVVSCTEMNRRGFTKALVGGVLGCSLPHATDAAQSPTPAKSAATGNSLYHVGGDYHAVKIGEDSLERRDRINQWTSRRNFEYHKRFGVKHLTNIMSGAWDLDLMQRWKDDCDRAEMIWEAIRMDSDYIYLASGDDRNRKIDEIADNIRKASQVDVPVITMHWTLIPIRRNTKTTGRGGATYSGFKLEDDWRSLPVGEHGTVAYDEYWERIEYFLTRIIPVCEKCNVRLAVHPYDPPGLPLGYQGVDTWDAEPVSIMEALIRYEQIVDSPYNGFQLCLGTVMEGLRDPKNELLPIVRHFAEKGKIHQIHMRNIRGGLHHFEEVYIDEGEADFLEVLRILRDTGYQWSICPDHVPKHPDDPEGFEAFAHAFGYIQSLIETANTETM